MGEPLRMRGGSHHEEGYHHQEQDNSTSDPNAACCGGTALLSYSCPKCIDSTSPEQTSDRPMCRPFYKVTDQCASKVPGQERQVEELCPTGEH